MSVIDLEFQVDGLTLTARRYQQGGQRVIALHGWQDNSASFEFIAPYLESADLVCIDLAGHGMSSHRSKDSAYNIWQDVSEVLSVAKQLNWKKFSLIGHSRGAIISTLIAGTFPDKIEGIFLIEGIMPMLSKAEDTPAQLARAIKDKEKYNERPAIEWSTLNDAILARKNGQFSVSYDAAEAIVKRGCRQLEGGAYQWSCDPRLLGASEVKFSKEQMDAFIANAIPEIQLLLGDKNGLVAWSGDNFKKIKAYPNINYQILPGGHHLHMEESAEVIGQFINNSMSGENND